MLSEYQNKLLPPHHPVTRQIRAVVQSILHNSNLGTLADPTEDMLQNAMGAHVPIRGDVSRPEDTKWNLLVVNDDRTVNASATWGW
jgi:metalloendopeptidase OMA1, mitochondrial